jgi:hypothetical protein
MPYLHLDLPGTYPVEVKRELASRLCKTARDQRRCDFPPIPAAQRPAPNLGSWDHCLRLAETSEV